MSNVIISNPSCRFKSEFTVGIKTPKQRVFLLSSGQRNTTDLIGSIIIKQIRESYFIPAVVINEITNFRTQIQAINLVIL